MRVSIDETAAEHGALGAGVADAVCLKISRCGGIGGLIAAATLVRASGAEPYIASTFDGPLGVAAGVHAAAALASRGAVPHCGLATLGLFADIEDPLPARATGASPAWPSQVDPRGLGVGSVARRSALRAPRATLRSGLSSEQARCARPGRRTDAARPIRRHCRRGHRGSRQLDA